MHHGSVKSLHGYGDNLNEEKLPQILDYIGKAKGFQTKYDKHDFPLDIG
jgi:hypothetical protein